MIELIDEIEALDSVIYDHKAELSNMYTRRKILVNRLQNICKHPTYRNNMCIICGKEYSSRIDIIGSNGNNGEHYDS